MLRYVIISFLILFFISCSTERPNIGKINSYPKDFVDKTVKVEGVVTDRFSLLVYSYFELEDSSSSIYVVTSEKLPQVGEKIDVVGKVMYYTIGTQDVLAIVEDSE